MKRKILARLSLTSTILLTGCNLLAPSPEKFPPPPANCPVSVHASPAVKTWFEQQNEPPEVLHYLWLVGQQQAAIDSACGNR